MKEFKLYYPIKPWLLSQKFGETAYLQYYKDNGVDFKGHNGDDAIAVHGHPIYAAHDGTAYYEIDEKQGHGVVVKANGTYLYNGQTVSFKTIYWHMVDSSKEPQYRSPVEDYRDLTHMGMPVKAGDLIGYVNTTGLSTGDHLHFGLKPTYPTDPDWSIGGNLLADNGYQGAIDPAPFFNGLYAEDIAGVPKPFTTDIKYGDMGSEVSRLQSFLKTLGYFPSAQAITGYYGDKTRNAVAHFQDDHVKLPPWETLYWIGKVVGPKTRLELNNIINQYNV